MGKAEEVMREALGDFLGILEYKVRNGVILEKDVKTIMETIKAGGGVQVTVKELAGYYNQSEDNIRHVIHRNLMPPPTRRVYYDFKAFRDKVPPKWTKRSSLPDD